MLHNLVRLLTGSAADFLDDYFESAILKGWLSSSGIIGTKVGPMSQGSGLVLLFHNMGEHDGGLGSWAFHKGGNGGFTQVLARAAQSFGAEIKLGAEVDRVITSNGRATGVALKDGTELSAKVVVSAADPRRTFTQFVDPRELPHDLVDNLRRYRYQGTSSKVNFALDGLPRYPVARAIAPTCSAASPTSRRRWSTSSAPSTKRSTAGTRHGPYIDGAIQSTIDPDMAPPGKHVMSCFIHYTPYHLQGSDWTKEREHMADNVQNTLESFFPGFSDLVLQREIVTPLDIEQVAGLPEGNIFHGEMLAPQTYFFRPAPGWNQYRTPIDGYYQCGSGTHPGGCVSAAARADSPASRSSAICLVDQMLIDVRSVSPPPSRTSGARTAMPVAATASSVITSITVASAFTAGVAAARALE